MVARDRLPNARRQDVLRKPEFILFSDILGISMLVDAIDHVGGPGISESTVLGPFYAGPQPERAFFCGTRTANRWRCMAASLCRAIPGSLAVLPPAVPCVRRFSDRGNSSRIKLVEALRAAVIQLRKKLCSRSAFGGGDIHQNDRVGWPEAEIGQRGFPHRLRAPILRTLRYAERSTNDGRGTAMPR
jgi:hypothetical protein